MTQKFREGGKNEWGNKVKLSETSDGNLAYLRPDCYLCLAQIRAKPKGDIGLFPSKLLIGTPYPSSTHSGREKEISDIYLRQYMGKILSLVSLAGGPVAQTVPLDFVVHNIQPGDWILVKDC